MGFYELGFLVVYLVQWILADGLVPLIRIYVVMGLLNYVMEEGRFSKLTDLFGKYGFLGTQDLNIRSSWAKYHQECHCPGHRYLCQTDAEKIAGICAGDRFDLVGGIGSFLAASDVIRSGIGAAALVVLVILVAVPLSKVGIMTFFTGFWQPLWSRWQIKRISNAILVAAKGGGMLFKTADQLRHTDLYHGGNDDINRRQMM